MLSRLAHRRGLPTVAALIRRWIAEEQSANRFSAGLLAQQREGLALNVRPLALMGDRRR